MNEEVKTYVKGKREPHIVIEMPMPKNCRECPMMASVDDYSYFCALTKEKIGNWFEEWLPFSEAPYSTERRSDCPLREVIRCGKCRHYLGNHDVPGCAPCDFWGIGAVMWDDYCKRGERWEG